MVLSEVVKRLESEGYEPSGERINYMIRRGYVSRPKLNSSLQFEFEKRHLRQIRKYLDNPPKRGPKPQAATA